MISLYIHIGGDAMVRTDDLVGIFDSRVQQSLITKAFIHKANETESNEILDVDEIKSFVVTKTKIFYSPISSSTLKKRAVSILSTEL